MKVDWIHMHCIVCLNSDRLTDEHIIPKSLGGILTCRFLCATCNSNFGAGFEANARLAPELRKAAARLETIPKLKGKLEHGAEYKAQFGDQSLEKNLGKDGHFGTAKLEDGSLIVPESDVSKQLKSVLQKDGLTDPEISDAVDKWEAAPPDEIVEISDGYRIRKWQEHPATPTYTETPLSPLVPLKIAYEYAALLVGGAIYCPEFQGLRQILLDQNEDMARQMVTYNWAKEPDAFHGIAFEDNHKVAQFQVRLFGLLAYTARFNGVTIEHKPIVYTHRLDTGKDWGHVPD